MKLISPLEGWPRESNGTTFDDEVYAKVGDVVHRMVGEPLQKVIDALASELNVRVQNLDSALQDRIMTLYNRANGN